MLYSVCTTDSNSEFSKTGLLRLGLCNKSLYFTEYIFYLPYASWHRTNLRSKWEQRLVGRYGTCHTPAATPVDSNKSSKCSLKWHQTGCGCALWLYCRNISDVMHLPPIKIFCPLLLPPPTWSTKPINVDFRLYWHLVAKNIDRK